MTFFFVILTAIAASTQRDARNNSDDYNRPCSAGVQLACALVVELRHDIEAATHQPRFVPLCLQVSSLG